MFPGSAGSDTCANFTLSCQAINGTDTTWVNAGTFNWNKGKSRYFRTAGVPNATGKYKIAVHSNRPAGHVEVTWLRDTSKAVTPPTYVYNAHSVGWTDGLSAEFDEAIGQGTNAPHSFGWAFGAPYDQIPAFTGPNWFRQIQFDLPIDPDPSRPQLYNGSDPNLGYVDATVLILQVADLGDPVGGQGSFTSVRVIVAQELSGYFNQFDFPVVATSAAPFAGAAVPLNLGTVFPEPLAVSIEVFGPDVIEWDAVALMPFSAIDPTSTPSIAPAAATDRIVVAWPNPFRTETNLRFELARDQGVTVRVFDVSGRLVRNLAEERLPAGSHTVRWDGRADSGVRVASGVYFYRLEAASGLESKKVVLLR
jgi:hypothetical protein